MNEHLTDMIEEAIDAVHDVDVTHKDYAQSIAKAITARLHECVKPLKWVRVFDRNGRIDMQAETSFGYYVISEDANYGDAKCYLWVAGNAGDYDRKFPDMATAQAAAQVMYAAQVIEGLDL